MRTSYKVLKLKNKMYYSDVALPITVAFHRLFD